MCARLPRKFVPLQRSLTDEQCAISYFPFMKCVTNQTIPLLRKWFMKWRRRWFGTFLPFFRQFARTADVIAISLVHEIKSETFISFLNFTWTFRYAFESASSFDDGKFHKNRRETLEFSLTEKLLLKQLFWWLEIILIVIVELLRTFTKYQPKGLWYFFF